MDRFKERVANAALDGAVKAIQDEFRMHHVVVIQKDKLTRQVKVWHPTASVSGPRYFIVKVSEPL